MPKNNYLKSMFEHMKSLGFYNEYNSYADFQAQKFGINKKEIDRNEDFENWKNGLSLEEKSQFEEMFGKD